MVHWSKVRLMGGLDGECMVESRRGLDLLAEFKVTGEMPRFWPLAPDMVQEFEELDGPDADPNELSLTVAEIDWTGFPSDETRAGLYFVDGGKLYLPKRTRDKLGL